MYAKYLGQPHCVSIIFLIIITIIIIISNDNFSFNSHAINIKAGWFAPSTLIITIIIIIDNYYTTLLYKYVKKLIKMFLKKNYLECFQLFSHLQDGALLLALNTFTSKN